MMSFFRRTSFVVILLLAVTQLQAATVTFNEQNFSTWNAVEVNGIVGGQTGTLISSGGNAGSYWQVRTNTNTTTNTISSPASSFTYDFSAGAINQINFTVDYLLENSFGQGHRFGLFAVQGGNFFSTIGAITDSNAADFGNWLSFGETVSVSDFSLVEGAGVLDFSAGANDVQFGLRTANTGGLGITIGYDNFNVELSTVSAVPLPAAAWLFGSAILGLGLFRKKSKLVS